MNPIIDPSIWYTIQCGNGVVTACFAFGIISGCAAIVIGAVILAQCGMDEVCTAQKIALFTCIVMVSICILLGCFFPNGDTIMKQEITKQITPGNIEMFKNEARSLVEYIIEKVKELK